MMTTTKMNTATVIYNNVRYLPFTLLDILPGNVGKLGWHYTWLNTNRSSGWFALRKAANTDEEAPWFECHVEESAGWKSMILWIGRFELVLDWEKKQENNHALNTS